ncbi:hypothetical protein BU17DRAFT_69242 [Hysterangium stoloniferum]|nr:hypothetical protein BU17DRAFT_69242 [Hysterangium stoloniferum]
MDGIEEELRSNSKSRSQVGLGSYKGYTSLPKGNPTNWLFLMLLTDRILWAHSQGPLELSIPSTFKLHQHPHSNKYDRNGVGGMPVSKSMRELYLGYDDAVAKALLGCFFSSISAHAHLTKSLANVFWLASSEKFLLMSFDSKYVQNLKEWWLELNEPTGVNDWFKALLESEPSFKHEVWKFPICMALAHNPMFVLDEQCRLEHWQRPNHGFGMTSTFHTPDEVILNSVCRVLHMGICVGYIGSCYDCVATPCKPTAPNGISSYYLSVFNQVDISEAVGVPILTYTLPVIQTRLCLFCLVML